MLIQPHSSPQLGGGEAFPPLFFLKIKKHPILEKKSPDCVHFWVQHLKHLTMSWIRLCLDNCSAVSKVIQYIYIQNYAYSDICRHTQAYSALLRHIHTYWDHIKAYSAPSVTLAYSQPCHIPSPGIFRTGGIFNTLWNFDQVYSKPCQSQNELFRHYSAIFRTLCNASTCINLACSESCNI